MAAGSRGDPLALAVLLCLGERSMHPYEVSATLRQRRKHESVRLNYGALHAVVASLERRGFIAAQETKRAGRLPERTVYRLTGAGRICRKSGPSTLSASSPRCMPRVSSPRNTKCRGGRGTRST